MPKRTNDFQSLIALIEYQLAPTNAHVTESMLLHDSVEDQKREIDIFIEANVGAHLITIGIECIDHTRKATVEWIDKLIGKYKNLPVDKIIAVSRAGFTKNALKKAKHENIVPLTLEEATNSDWIKVVDKLTTITLKSFILPNLTNVALFLKEDPLHSFLLDFDVKQADLYTSTGLTRGKCFEFVNRTLSDQNVLKMIEEKAFTDSNTNIKLTIGFEQGSYIIDNVGSKHEIHSIQIEAICQREESIVSLERASYGPSEVAFGTGDSFGHRLTITVVENPEKEASFGLSIQKVKGSSPKGEKNPK